MIKNTIIATVVIVGLAVCLVTHTIYTLAACALVVGVSNLFKVVRAR